MVATIAEKDHISIEFAIEIRKVIIIQDGVRTDPESALSPEAPADSGIFLQLDGREKRSFSGPRSRFRRQLVICE